MKTNEVNELALKRDELDKQLTMLSEFHTLIDSNNELSAEKVGEVINGLNSITIY